ncbi:LLM class flavin-dependent oxidoreductase [Kibdelosporangium phytohabitans]|uniref:Monooxygenase n=1 Tax=Kibdelosporangium phytohabitans TaxID=860235 RepID=A0A0N7F4N3_9PSEU|nr:LLM class flavin-dependent oxidoreductase [Kibdelosporangium phytohabitans]ALG11911.1 monooxygenase [Kibdelosporangium phytohabitans]MBE1463362.1 luciferase family oxidoreductase group 1 [Kibdelosporangium phytohabitans]
MSRLHQAEVRLSVLDTSPIVAGATPRQALHNTVDLAMLADSLGYHRYWVPEHHSMRGVASSSPAVLIGHIADATRHLRVGAGGVLLPNHAPIVVAEQFGTLVAFHPGRIDLGIGRAPGGSKHAVEHVRPERERTAKPLRAQLEELLGYLDPREEDSVKAIPVVGGNVPALWLLGQSPTSAQLAGELGMSYAYAHHLRPDGVADTVRAYREHFRPSAGAAEPTVLVSASVIAADDDEHAGWLAGSTRLKVLSRTLGTRIRLPSPEDAAAYPYTGDDRAEIARHSGRVLVGGPETVAKHLQKVLDDTGADELMVTTPVYDHAERRRSYELLASIADGLRPGSRT